MLKKTGYYAAICKEDSIRVLTGLPDCPYPVAAVLRKDTCCIPISMDDNGKLYCRLEVATRSLSAFPSDLVICDVYPVKQSKMVITEQDYIHDCIGGALIPHSINNPVELVADFYDLF